MDDRIILAEAMGWELKHDDDMGHNMWHSPDGFSLYSDIKVAFDPFTDANDDYSVLEWMRKLAKLKGPHGQDTATTQRFALAGRIRKEFKVMPQQVRYQIGNYARAVLKVIGEK